MQPWLCIMQLDADFYHNSQNPHHTQIVGYATQTQQSRSEGRGEQERKVRSRKFITKKQQQKAKR